jgi:hypothetical protein
MINDDNNLSDKDKEHQKQTSKDDIPLWLQGLHDAENKNLSSDENENNQNEADWVKESTKRISNSPTIQDAKTGESENDQAQASQSKDQSREEKYNKSNHVEETDLNKDEHQNYQPEQDDFVEISELDLKENHTPSHETEEEIILEGDDLPEWLHEMIVEEPEIVSGEVNPSSIERQEVQDEPTEPVDITQEIPVEPKEPSVDQSNIPVVIEESPSTPEIDTTLADIPAEEPMSEQLDTPKTLKFAKFLLDQGDYRQAMEIIKTYIDKPAYIGKIKNWLTDAVNNGANQNSDIWETLGDIALRENDPDHALDAYTKAIDILLGLTKGSHETD